MPHASGRARSAFLIENGYLEKVDDFEYEGRTVLASRLGYRITPLVRGPLPGPDLRNCRTRCFPEEMLRPEKQDLDVFAAGVDAIVEAQTRVALNYFEDGSVEAACPPIKALLHIMAHGEYRGHAARDDPRSRACSRANRCWRATGTRNGCGRSRRAISRCGPATRQALECGAQVDVESRLAEARKQLARVKCGGVSEELEGTIGADPSVG